MDILIAIPSFLVAIFILVGIHEFGHFWVARRCGVKVIRFSIGMGRVIWSRRGKDGVEYSLSAFPIGGYVSMVGHGEAVSAEDEPYAFDRKPVLSRIAIVAAGPLVNLLFAVAMYWLIFVAGVSGLAPVVGELPEGAPAAVAGMQAEDRIVAVNGVPVETWESASMALISALYEDAKVVLEVVPMASLPQPAENLLGSGTVLELNLDNYNPEPDEILEALGLRFWSPVIPAVIGQVVASSAAESAGIREGDVVTSINEAPISSWKDLVLVVSSSPQKTLSVTVRRDGRPVQLTLIPDNFETADGRFIGRAGVAPQITDEIRNSFNALEAETNYGPIEAIPKAFEKAWDMTTLTFSLIGKMFTGDVSSKHIGGPVQIAGIAGQAAQSGLIGFIGFLAMISLNLGLLNLLPVPVLDGGHLLYYVVELVKGSPVSIRVQGVGQRIGITLLLGLMVFAFYNDIARLL